MRSPSHGIFPLRLALGTLFKYRPPARPPPRPQTCGYITSVAMRNTAQRACFTCRKQKRKCTRELPECSLCLKHGRRCDYDEAIPAPTHPDVQQLPASHPHLSASSPGNTHVSPLRANGSSQDLALPLLAQSKFPASFFLDHDVFQLLGRSIEPATVKFPLSILDPVRDQARIRSDVDIYFNSTHTLFPISELAGSLIGSGADQIIQ